MKVGDIIRIPGVENIVLIAAEVSTGGWIARKIKCADIPDRPILEFLETLGRWGTWYSGAANSVTNAMPADIPWRLVHAKMRRLIHRGLVNGCSCGCRGDFELTDAGREWLYIERLKEVA